MAIETYITSNKHPDRESVFKAENMLREARRQKGIVNEAVPKICVLDPDGDILQHLQQKGIVSLVEGWACYHTTMHQFKINEEPIGIIAGEIGAPFAVLVAEELKASGCRFIISITSSGRLAATEASHILITEALRDEGTSYHYLPGSLRASIGPEAYSVVASIMDDEDGWLAKGVSWTTDAPFRETQAAIDQAVRLGAVAVEMESAGLYAFSNATGFPVACFAHMTNSMGNTDIDFEKGDLSGAAAGLQLIQRIFDGIESTKPQWLRGWTPQQGEA